MKPNLPSLVRSTAIFMTGFGIAWIIRTPTAPSVHRQSGVTALPQGGFRLLEATSSVPAIPKPPAVSTKPRLQDELITKANAELLDSQTRLAKAREAAFKSQPDLSYAYEAWRTYHNWQQNMNYLTADARSRWNDQEDATDRAVKSEVARKLLIQEIAARLADPASREWMIAWSEKIGANTEPGIQARLQWWSEDFASLPDFYQLPPSDVLASLLNPATSAATLTRFQITDDERSRIKPSLFFFLEGSAQAGVIANGGEAYYHRRKGPGIASLESEVETKNRQAVDLSNRAGNSK